MRRILCLLLGLTLATPAQAAPDEGEVLLQWNQLRGNPPAFARYLEAWLPMFRGQLLELPSGRRLTFEGAAAVREAVAVLKATAPLPPMQASPLIARAARAHVADLGPRGGRGHVGADGSSVGDRLSRQGQWFGTVSESCSFGAGNALHTILELVVDDGVASRGHRAMMLFATGGQVGIACGPHRDYGSMCVIDFASDFAEATTPEPVPPPDVVTPFDENKPFAMAPPQVPQGKPSSFDLEVVAEVNLLRSNPLAWAARLEALLPFFDGRLLRRPRQVALDWAGGVASFHLAIAYLKTAAPMPPPQLSLGLSAGARDYVRVRRAQPAFIDRNYGPTDAARRYGAGPLRGAMTMRGESPAFDVVATWFVRSTGPNRTFFEPELTQIGVGCGPGADKPLSCALIYGGSYRDFEPAELELLRVAQASLNAARTEPKALARRLRSFLPAVVGETLRTADGVAPLPGGRDALQKLIGRLDKASPLPPIKVPPQLTARARDFALTLAPGRLPRDSGSWPVRSPWQYGQPDGSASPDELVVFAPGGGEWLALNVLLLQPDWMLTRDELSVGLWCTSHTTKGQVCVVDSAVGWVQNGQPLPWVAP